VHVSPIGLHAVAGTSHFPFTQLSEQQSVLTVHDPWNDKHVEQFTPAKHDEPKQQPFVHVVVSQTQCETPPSPPDAHLCPVLHAGLVPQRHVPFEQLSANVVLHVLHAPPPVPQAVTEFVLHVLPVQQPFVHVTEHPAHALFTQ
jgi:hypothetical protein